MNVAPHCIEVILHYSRISSTHPTEDNLFHSYALCRCCEAFGCLHIGVDAGLLEEYGKKDFLAFLMCSRVRSRPLTPFFDPTLVGVCLDSHLLAVPHLDCTTYRAPLEAYKIGRSVKLCT